VDGLYLSKMMAWALSCNWVSELLRARFAAELGADGDSKLDAVADFAAHLLNSPVGDAVARIVLFGSVADGEARPESDIDLLIIGTENLRALGELSSAIAYDVLLERGELVSPMVYGWTEAEYPPTWFLYDSLRRGREVFRMQESELRHREAQGWWALAADYLRQAQGAGQDGSFRLAVDGAYNAAELALKGLLILRLERLPTSHGGLVQIFSREYIVTGEVDRSLGRQLSVALELRSKARYSPEAEITAEHLAQVTTLAQELVDLLERTLALLEQQF
jgi:uncharacterized protein (UPF0332 family)/predicted nucleotidyltransferase